MIPSLKLNERNEFEAVDTTDSVAVFWAMAVNEAYRDLASVAESIIGCDISNIKEFMDVILQANNEGFEYFKNLLALETPLGDALEAAGGFTRARAQQLVVSQRVEKAGIDSQAIFADLLAMKKSNN